jgi:signal transduction histidine kinase
MGADVRAAIGRAEALIEALLTLAGLGLTIVASIATLHAGTVQATARPDGGLEVVAVLPT